MNQEIDNVIKSSHQKLKSIIKVKEEEKEEEEDTDSEAELTTGVRTTKKRPNFTNDELFYDPDMDDKDQDYVNKQLKTDNPLTDAILNCPGCMTTLCMDCQRHEAYKSQYRAMFVSDCKVNDEEQLKYPREEFQTRALSSKRVSKNKKRNSPANQTVLLGDFDIFKPVQCRICNTEVGVYEEKEEIYHFFNVLASHS
jgi:hypothetical protein